MGTGRCWGRRCPSHCSFACKIQESPPFLVTLPIAPGQNKLERSRRQGSPGASHRITQGGCSRGEDRDPILNLPGAGWRLRSCTAWGPRSGDGHVLLPASSEGCVGTSSSHKQTAGKHGNYAGPQQAGGALFSSNAVAQSPGRMASKRSCSQV